MLHDLVETRVLHDRVETRSAPGNPAETWRFRTDSTPAFDASVFDVKALEARGCISGVAEAGRGGTVFFTLDGAALVLREFRRGGLVRHLSRRAYWQCGLERSRPMREFALLLQLEAKALPAPRVFAARRCRHGLFETGELVTYRLPGVSLPACLSENAGTDTVWQAIGQCIAEFHQSGVEHADLNAHNILWDAANQTVHLLDFDRGRLHAGAVVTPETPWANANLARLHRSFERLGLPSAGAEAIESAWRQAF